MKKKLIILDRDGVINYDSMDYIKSPEEWHAIPGSLAAIAKLNQAGYTVVVATNQSGIGRGLYDTPTLHRIHEKLRTELASFGGVVEEFFFCPHHPSETCQCRKPQLGMFHAIKNKYEIDLSNVYFIGDSPSDMQVAEKLPCKPILVLTSKGESTLKNNPKFLTIPHFVNLANAVDYILDHEQD
jgi:D-glycero-D-manno-heptose 1,7-bisphosphate phosphatase